MIPDRFAPVLDRAGTAGRAVRAAGTGCTSSAAASATCCVDAAGEDHDLDFTTDARPDRDQGSRSTAGPTRSGRRASGSARSAPSATTASYEITTFRAESYTDDSRKPHVTYADEIDLDLSRRDFTVNAMALEVTPARRRRWSIRSAAPPT